MTGMTQCRAVAPQPHFTECTDADRKAASLLHQFIEKQRRELRIPQRCFGVLATLQVPLVGEMVH